MKHVSAGRSGEHLIAQGPIDEILQLEIELAGEVTAAEERAESELTRATAEIANMKHDIIVDARREREHQLEEGIAQAEQAAREREERALADSRAFTESGSRFIEEAAARVMDMILPKKDQKAP
jgi:hypothetical protein